ncbi:NAD(P)-dependent oxidoreductase [Virgibacillus sp. AGTR]|uniref:NAD(P)-dependent oxidoreductase n=1 Tax=unclassified Virgibacillus TaxID=2620237 RepID=UPI000EF49750|nr:MULTISPECIES: NAD(P)-dependent oxidoreductase [unclassified Virgibacillus]MCC2251106.1 NAD(P)-dependent oxidoreductase [Virgibacillus sp. AGTR]QRZ19895.1 NAD(P)-dependent oxidoreductase [Virgibacillus sp. AGTR]
MKIGIIGASGKSGSLILKEAVKRNHDVTAIVRDAKKVSNDTVNVIEKNIFDIKTEDIKPYDVIVNAFNAPHGEEHQHIDAGRVLINALKQAPHTRLIVVGGAGSLFADENKSTLLLDTPDFPKAYLPTASNMGENLKELQNTAGIQWTYISPAAIFDPEGQRTGSYRLGKDTLMLNNKGESYISYADYAISVVDEIENPQHENERFTVVGEAK